MEKNVKFDQQTIEKLKNLRTEYTDLIVKIGMLESDKMLFDNEYNRIKKELLDKLNDVKKKEMDLIIEIKNKYNISEVELANLLKSEK